MRASRIPELDGVRGIAILSVVSYHYFNSQGLSGGPVTTFLQKVRALGWSGVDLFFVLSGFLIGGILLDARGSPNYFKVFYARRFFRIIPIYYAWVLLWVLLVTCAGHTLQAHSNSGRPVMAGWPVYRHFLFLQNLYPLTTYLGLGGAWLSPLWSLAVEEQFYLISPWVIRLLSKRGLHLTLTGIIIGTPFLRLGLLTAGHVSPIWIYFLMPCRGDALAIGVLVALLWRDDRFRERLAKNERSFTAAHIILGLGVLCLLVWWSESADFPTQTIGYTWIALFYAACLLSVLLWPANLLAKWLRMSWLRGLGIVSYCIYIIHGAVDTVLHGVLLKSPPRVSTPRGAAVSLLAALLTYVIARMSWRFFERPLLECGHRFKYDRPHEAITTGEPPSEEAIGALQ